MADMAPPKTPNAPRGTVHGASAQNLVAFTLRAAPVPQAILDFLRDNASVLRRLLRERGARDERGTTAAPVGGENGATTDQGVKGVAEVEEDEVDEEADVQTDVVRAPTVKPEGYWAALDEVCKRAGGEWTGIAERIWGFGPHGSGACILVDARGGVPNSCVFFPSNFSSYM
jgi:ribosome assembly protein 1